MKVMKQSVFVFVFVILAAVFVSRWGGDTDKEALREDKPQPGYDYFLLALTWPNQFCTTQNCSPSTPKQQKYFTIHGLWPHYTPTNYSTYCNSTYKFNSTDLVPMKKKLLEYWPDLKKATGGFKASMAFWRYEWDKHGTCASNSANTLSVKEYFEKSIALAEKYSAKIYEALRNKGVIPNGTEYRDLDILSAVAGGIGVVPSLGCDKGQALAEIRLCVKDDAVTLFDCGKLTFAAPPSRSSSSRSRSISGVSSVLETVHNAAGLL